MFNMQPLRIKVTAEDIRLGERNTTSACPIARRLKASYKPKSLCVDSNKIEMFFKTGTVTFEPDKAITKFIEEFDKGMSVKPQTFTLKIS